MPAIPNGCPIASQVHRVRDEGGASRSEVLRIWPDPAAWAHTATEGWHRWSPAIHVRWADMSAEEDEYPGEDNVGWDVPLRSLLTAVPSELRAAVAPLDDPACWLALRLLADVPDALDVLRDIPCLGGLLGDFLEAAQDRVAACASLRAALRRPRKHLLPLVGLPARKALLGVLIRLDEKALSIPGPPTLIQVLTSTDATVSKWLNHLPSIRADVVMVLMDPVLTGLSTFALLADPDDCIGFGLHHYLNRVGAARARGLVPLRPARFSSRAELLEVELDRRRGERWNPGAYPESFETPTDDRLLLQGVPRVELRPVTTAAEMHETAVKDRLCIASASSYPRRAMVGDGAMYLAVWTEDEVAMRASVWLTVSDFAGWTVEDVRMRFNQPAPEWLHDRLSRWARELSRAPLGPPMEPLKRAPPLAQPRLPFRWASSPLDCPDSFGAPPPSGGPPEEEAGWVWELLAQRGLRLRA